MRILSDETKVYEILAEVKDLAGKIKDYEGEADQELVVNWVYDTLKLVGKLGAAMEEFEYCFGYLEEGLKKLSLIFVFKGSKLNFLENLSRP